MTAEKLVAAVRRELAAVADPARAPAMQAYMKSTMPFYGVPMPVTRSLVRRLLREHPIGSRDEWEDVVRRLFDEAAYREEQYAALAVAGQSRFRVYQTLDTLPLYRHLIVEGDWWDLVDDVSHRVGDVLLAERAETSAVMRTWSGEPNLWLRRSSIICQLGHKAKTDTTLLTDVIEPNIGDRDFFIRKAIGWALRDYARTDPLWVRAYVAVRDTELAPLSRREALKHLT